jgi:competence protein ComEC
VHVVALIAFVAGIAWLQQSAALPVAEVLAVAGAAALLSLGTGVAGARRRACRARAAGALYAPPVEAAAALAVAAGAAAAGFVYAAVLAHLRLADELPAADEGRDLVVVGTVASLPADLARGTRFEFLVEHVETAGARLPERLALAWYAPDARVRPAERWRFTVRLRRPHGTLNPGGFDLEGWLFERGLRAVGYVRDATGDGAALRLSARVWSFGGAIDDARDHLRAALRDALAGRRYAGVLIALVLGDQRAIAESDWQLFNRTGIAHLVSISGLHITMIAGLVATATSFGWRRSRRLLRAATAQAAAACAAMGAAFAYCLLAGWGVPAQRTFFMLATVCAALLLRARPGTSATLALAAAVVCALDPWAVLAPGFWLSFGAVAAILFAVQGRATAVAPGGWRTRLREAARVQLAVTLALVPLTIALFRHVSLVSPLANAVAIPVVSLLVTPLALLAAACVWLPPPLASFALPPLAVAHALFETLAAVLHGAASLPWAVVSLPAPPWWSVPVAAAGVAWLLAPRGWPLRGIGWIALLPLFVLPAERPRGGELWVTAVDVGQGMAVLVETATHTLLYDTGPRYAGGADAGARVIVPLLRWRGITALDWLVVSHLDADHSGGAASILRELAVARVLTSILPPHPSLQGAPQVQRCEAGQRLALGAAVLDVLHPRAADYTAIPVREPNAMSCVVRVQAGAFRVLLTGDLPARQEAELLDRTADVQAELVSAPHHGSRHSSSEGFVQATGARWVAVQAGHRNRYGHPDAAVVDRWTRHGARVERTDASGAIQWRLGATGEADVRRWRHWRPRYWHDRTARAGATATPSPGVMPAGAPDERTGPAAPDPAATPTDDTTGIEVATPPASDAGPF